jgi:ribosomal protein S18 acetylase RimI-like enzyme
MMMSPLEIREFRACDQAGVEQLWRTTGVVPAGSNPAVVVDAYARAGNAIILVVSVPTGAGDSRVAATAIAVDENGRDGTLYCLATCQAFKRQGLGRAVLQAAVRWLVARGALTIKLRVDADNTVARAFYRNLGFKEAGAIHLTKVLSIVSRDI